MKYVVFLIALAGAGASGYLCYTWYSQGIADVTEAEIQKAQDQLAQDKARGQRGRGARETNVAERVGRFRSWMYLGISAGLGLLGAFIVLTRLGILAAIVMIPMPIVTGYFYLPSFLFTGAILLAGLLAVFVWPLPKEKKEKESESRSTATPKVVSSFACESCHSVLKTANPVPVGKRIKCPKCAHPTLIRATQPAAHVKSREEQREPALSGASGFMGWLLFLLSMGGAGAIGYLLATTNAIQKFIVN